MMRCFERWLHHIGMTETEKQECRRRAAQGFEQPAEIFLLGASRKLQCQMLRALGTRPARRQSSCRLGNWRIWLCSPDEHENPHNGFLEPGQKSAGKGCVILLACAGRGGRLRAREAWNRGCDGTAGRLQNVPVLAVQIEFCTRLENRQLGRQENREALLQQTAEDFLGRQVPTFTVSAGRRGAAAESACGISWPNCCVNEKGADVCSVKSSIRAFSFSISWSIIWTTMCPCRSVACKKRGLQGMISSSTSSTRRATA